MGKNYVRIFVAAAAVLKKDGKFLLVQEMKEAAYGLWGLPGGHVEDGETIEEAAVREVKEEAGYSIKLGEKIGIFQDAGDDQVRHVFVGEIIDGELGFSRKEIMDAQWFSLDQLKMIYDQLRGPWVMEAITKSQQEFTK